MLYIAPPSIDTWLIKRARFVPWKEIPMIVTVIWTWTSGVSGDTDCWFESAVHLQLHIWSCGTGKGVHAFEAGSGAWSGFHAFYVCWLRVDCWVSLPEKRWWTISISIQRFQCSPARVWKISRLTNAQCKPRGCRLVKRIRNVSDRNCIEICLVPRRVCQFSIEQLDPALLTGTDGPAKLLAELEIGRFQRTGFQEMPRAYETLWENSVSTRWFGANGRCIWQQSRLRSEIWRLSIPKTKISQNELGYHALKNSGLSREEQRMGFVPCRWDLRFCEDQSDVEKPLSSRNAH